MPCRRDSFLGKWIKEWWQPYKQRGIVVDDPKLSPEGNKVGEKKLVERWYYNSVEYKTNVEIEWDGEQWQRKQGK